MAWANGALQPYVPPWALSPFHSPHNLSPFHSPHNLSPFHHHHHLQHPHPYWDEPDLRLSPWLPTPDLYTPHPICEICEIQNAVPNMPSILHDLSLHDPYHHAQMLQLHDEIHGHYAHDPDSYYLRREIEKLGKMLLRVQRRSPWGYEGQDLLVKYLGRRGRRKRYGGWHAGLEMEMGWGGRRY